VTGTGCAGVRGHARSHRAPADSVGYVQLNESSLSRFENLQAQKNPAKAGFFAFHKKDYFLERPLKLLSRVSISIHSSIWMKSATEISVPFFSLAGFMTLPEVSPRAAFSV